DHATLCRAIIDDQGTFAHERRVTSRPRRRLAGTGPRAHGKVKRGPPAGLACDRHRTAHQLGETFADDEPQASTAKLPRRRTVNLAEGFEQPLLLVARDPDAGIGDLVAQEDLTRFRRPVHADRYHDFALLGELHGVADQVDQNL